MTVYVIGGGPAGMIAAVHAAQSGHAVTLFERNEKLGKKLYITGKGRCNVTNIADRDSFFSHVLRNPRFLYSAFSHFDNLALMEAIELHLKNALKMLSWHFDVIKGKIIILLPPRFLIRKMLSLII